MSQVTDYIDSHFEETLARLKRWVSQPSISTENIGVADMSLLAAREMREAGFEVSVHPTDGYPIILAQIGAPGLPTILIYNHYDVQPVGNLSEWSSHPFNPEIRDGKMYGRGVADTKSNIVSRLDALLAVKAVSGDLPVRIIWLLEGEEEIGSVHLDPFLEANRDALRADGCIWEFGNYTYDGVPNITIGLKGMLTVELIARGANRDLHSGMAASVQSPVWRLVWALSTIKGQDGRIQIPGFYDSVHVPTPDLSALIERMPDETKREMRNLGLDSYLNGLKGREVYAATSFSPTANILGIEAGYNGQGSKTVLPHEARCKLDIRLVPDQEPEPVFQSLRTFLKEKGFHDVEVKRVENEGDLLPGISDPTNPFIQKVVQACREVSGREPVINPSSGGSGPIGPFTLKPPRGLGLPVAAFGTGYPDTRAHGPDENIRLTDMKAHMYTIARLVELMQR